jgi:segregation and condensation protein B
MMSQMSEGTSEQIEAAIRLAEAAVFASREPVSLRALGTLLPEDVDIESVVAELRARYADRGMELVEAAGGLQFRTRADLAKHLRKVVEQPRRLPRAALEALAIVAYHQPITRTEIEEMRGASLSQQTMDLLLDQGLIAVRGRKETPGRPTLWGTTANFLALFGIKDIRDLPRREELIAENVPVAAETPASEAPSDPPEAEEPRGEPPEAPGP